MIMMFVLLYRCIWFTFLLLMCIIFPCSLQDGSYLLSHASKDSSVCLYKSSTDKTSGTYNLHEAHSNLPKAPSSLSVPWVPVNPNLLLSYHIHHGRPPCTFPPVPTMNTGNSKVSRCSVFVLCWHNLFKLHNIFRKSVLRVNRLSFLNSPSKNAGWLPVLLIHGLRNLQSRLIF